MDQLLSSSIGVGTPAPINTQYLGDGYETAAKSRPEWLEVIASTPSITQQVSEAHDRTLREMAALDARSSPFRYPVPGEIREKELAAGLERRSLIDFADFSDYRVIIERRDNRRHTGAGWDGYD